MARKAAPTIRMPASAGIRLRGELIAVAQRHHFRIIALSGFEQPVPMRFGDNKGTQALKVHLVADLAACVRIEDQYSRLHAIVPLYHRWIEGNDAGERVRDRFLTLVAETYAVLRERREIYDISSFDGAALLREAARQLQVPLLGDHECRDRLVELTRLDLQKSRRRFGF